MAVVAGVAWAATRSSSSPRAAPAATATSAASQAQRAPAQPTAAATSTAGQPSAGAAAAGGTQRIQGPSEDMQWGPVQVTVVLKDKRITDVQATAPTERARSAFINNQALPMLRQEALQAQVANIKNIYGISGATLTSEAYYQSLLAALQQAHLVTGS